MIKEFKDVFKTKKGVLLILSMLTLAICAYLNLITVKTLMIGSDPLNPDAFGISFGTLFLSFLPMITSELMAECFGWKKGFVISSIAYTVCLVFTLIMWGSTFIPGLVFLGDDPFVAMNSYNLVFGASPLILIASAIAYYLGIFFNCFIMGKLKENAQKTGDNKIKLFGRFVISTVIGQTLDNAIFFAVPWIIGHVLLNSIEFAVWNFTYVWQQTFAALIIEVIFEIVFFAFTAYLVKKVNSMPEGLTIIVDNETKEVTEIVD